MSIYLNDWASGGFIDMVADFSGIFMTRDEYLAEKSPYANEQYWLEKKEALREALATDYFQGLEVLLASYSNANYEGDAFVLFRKDGALFEVNGGHCSCHGLEGQWSPEETTVEALRQRLEEGRLGQSDYGACNCFAKELCEVLSTLELSA